MFALLVGGLTLAALPTILLILICIGVFLLVVYWVIQWFFPEPAKAHAWHIVMILGSIILLIWLIQLATGASVFGR